MKTVARGEDDLVVSFCQAGEEDQGKQCGNRFWKHLSSTTSMHQTPHPNTLYSQNSPQTTGVGCHCQHNFRGLSVISGGGQHLNCLNLWQVCRDCLFYESVFSRKTLFNNTQNLCVWIILISSQPKNTTFKTQHQITKDWFHIQNLKLKLKLKETSIQSVLKGTYHLGET